MIRKEKVDRKLFIRIFSILFLTPTYSEWVVKSLLVMSTKYENNEILVEKNISQK